MAQLSSGGTAAISVTVSNAATNTVAVQGDGSFAQTYFGGYLIC